MLIADLNKQSLIASAIVAKATFKLAEGYGFVIVHEKATLNEFYCIYHGKAAGSPRKRWVYVESVPRNLSPQYFSDFGGYASHFAQTKKAEFIRCRIQNPRRLAILTKEKIKIKASINPLITMQIMWTMFDTAKGIYKQKPRPPFWLLVRQEERRDGNLPTPPAFPNIPAEEVHCYHDLCPSCGEEHLFAHYPDGKSICGSDLAYTKSNPALYYVRYHAGRFIFAFRKPGIATKMSNVFPVRPEPQETDPQGIKGGW